MAINVRCKCRAQNVVSDKKAGTLVPCRKCGEPLQIPLPEPESEADPPLLPTERPCPYCNETMLSTDAKCPSCGQQMRLARGTRSSDLVLRNRVDEAGRSALLWAGVGLVLCQVVAPVAVIRGWKSRKLAQEAGMDWPFAGALGFIIGTLVTMALVLFVALTIARW